MAEHTAEDIERLRWMPANELAEALGELWPHAKGVADLHSMAVVLHQYRTDAGAFRKMLEQLENELPRELLP